MNHFDHHFSGGRKAQTALLILAGDPPSEALLKDAIARTSYIAAADRGMDVLVRGGIVPDEIFGDMDSMSEESRAFLTKVEDRVHYLPVEKDDTDGQVAVDGLFARGFQEVLVLGALGGRRDHEWGNILLCAHYGRQGKRLIIEDECNCIAYLPEGHFTFDAVSRYFSLIPLSNVVLTLQGFYYPLEEVAIPFGISRTLSNVFIDKTAKVTVHRGETLVMICEDKKGVS